MPELLNDWYYAFEAGRNPSKAFPSLTVSVAPFAIGDVTKVIAVQESTGDCAEWDGICVVKLADGRYARVSGWCDTSGWG